MPYLVNAVYPSFFPDIPDSDDGTDGIQRDDLIQVFLTGHPDAEPADRCGGGRDAPTEHGHPAVHLVCSTLGVIGGDLAGFPNGRRLDDDIIDVALRVAMGVLLPGHDAAADTLGDGVDANDRSFLSAFPYVAYPPLGVDDVALTDRTPHHG